MKSLIRIDGIWLYGEITSLKEFVGQIVHEHQINSKNKIELLSVGPILHFRINQSQIAFATEMEES